MSEVKKSGHSHHQRGRFSGKIGYVLAVAGSAVGLGNIWRFPYLAAKYGGGMFLLVYILLTVSFGYVLIMSETALGRMTRKSPVGAFEHFGKSAPFKIGGWLNAVIPMLIVPYYSTIGGWVIKYLVEYLRGNVQKVSEDGYFGSFIADSWQVEAWFLVFAVLVFAIILGGVKNGVELMSKIMMPVLVVLAVIVAIYSMTRPGAMEGVKYFLIPNFKNFSWMTVVTAMGQMFYSLSIAMGILYTYGSYMHKKLDMEQSTTQVEIFDTGIAILAGLDDHSGSVCFLRRKSGYTAGRSFTDVYYAAEGFCNYGSRNRCRNPVFRAGSSCGTYQCGFSDGDKCIYLYG